MTDGERFLARVRARLRADHSEAAPRSYRLASSVRMPWLVGMVLFGLISLGTLSLVGRTGGSVNVPRAIVDAQEAIATQAAQSVRRGLNEGVDDLEQAAATLAQGDTAGDAKWLLESVLAVHGRYRSVYLWDVESKKVVDHAGEDPRPEALGDSKLSGSGMRDAAELGGVRSPVISLYAETHRPGRPPELIVGEYDPSFLRFPLEVAEPGSAWLVNSDSEVVGALSGFRAFQTLDRRQLRDAAAKAAAGSTGASVTDASIDRSEIIGWAPVSGVGPAGGHDWGVVTARAVDSVSLPEVDFRREAILVGLLIALFTVLVFGWMWIVLFRPLHRLQQEAERIAYGDLSRSVEVIRYDEIGLVARALERIRVVLIRRRVRGDAESRD